MFLFSTPSLILFIPAVFYLTSMLFMVVGKVPQTEQTAQPVSVAFKQPEQIVLSACYIQYIENNRIQSAQPDFSTFQPTKFIPPEMVGVSPDFVVAKEAHPCGYRIFSRPPPRA
ncbi:MAG: hypothetical protein LBN37_03420 [Bacteroidales bacterium]|jgi:hypothetical protein|nr:hypothetical protein [Bacteroidales bacterium]